jgi:adenylyltransferase/sulfurtransferase
MTDVLRITPQQLTADATAAAGEDRFARFKLIGWWDQARLGAARVLVAGAGALGNEIVKNLALLGVGHVLVADMDRVENSNLSRSVLYRQADNGQFKAPAAARAARDLYPAIRAHAFVGNLVHDLGLGAFRWADVVIAGLDNREARLAINRNCYRVNRPFIDGAIETLDGSARVFLPPDGPCYECTMSQQDWKLLQMRRSCNLLRVTEMEAGKTPTTPTVSSIVAAVQCQEAVKLLHGMKTLAGEAWVFSGVTADAYTTRFQRKPDCYSHDTLDEVIALDAGAADVSAADVLARAREHLGAPAQLELCREVLEKLTCPRCGDEEQVFASLGKVPADQAWCPRCRAAGHHVRRDVVTFHTVRGDEPLARRPLAEIGVPPFDILVARGADGRSAGFELTGDAATVLGPLLGDDALELE